MTNKTPHYRRAVFATIATVLTIALMQVAIREQLLFLAVLSVVLVAPAVVCTVLYWLDLRSRWINPEEISYATLAYVVGMSLLCLLLTPMFAMVRNAAVSTQSRTNLKKIAEAMHEYHDANKQFPPSALRDAKGRPLLSWRVAMLPYLGEKALYDRFNLNEPWDSPHNLQLLLLMPKVFAPPPDRGVPCKPHETFYQGFVGPGTIFEDRPDGIAYRQLVNGSSNTIMLAEAGQPVPWTKPADLDYDPKGPLPSLGGIFNGQNHWYQFLESLIICVNFAYADGSVQCVDLPINEEDLRAGIERTSRVIHRHFER